LSDAEVDEMMKEAKVDRMGMFSYAEFVDALMRAASTK
jgi:Ca2+-binding EF-hand superfamily protein